MIDENEVTEVTENEQEQIQAEQERREQERLEQERIEAERQAELERQEAEERAREQARIEHENFLNSFPETTVFYQELKEEGDVKWLGGTVKDAHTAERYGWLDNHYDESELTFVPYNKELTSGVYYVKGHEKPDETEQALIEQKIKEIDSQLEQYMDNKVHVEKDYKNIESCVSYFNSTDDEFRSNARAALRWRDDIYKVGREVRDKVLAGELDWHEVDMQYILDRVDPLEW